MAFYKSQILVISLYIFPDFQSLHLKFKVKLVASIGWQVEQTHLFPRFPHLFFLLRFP